MFGTSVSAVLSSPNWPMEKQYCSRQGHINCISSSLHSGKCLQDTLSGDDSVVRTTAINVPLLPMF